MLDRTQAWRLIAGQFQSEIDAAWKRRGIAAQAKLAGAVSAADSRLLELKAEVTEACRLAGYKPPEFMFMRTAEGFVDEEADTQPEIEVKV